MDVHHVARLVVGELDVRAQLGRDRQVRHDMLGREVRGRAVVIAARDVDLEMRVGAHRRAEVVNHRYGATLELLVGPDLVDRTGQDLVGKIVLVAELGPDVLVQGSRIRPHDVRVGRIGGHVLEAAVGLPAEEPAVEPAHGSTFSPQELGEEADVLDAEVDPLDIGSRQARESGDLRDGGPALGVGQARPAGEDSRVLGTRVGLGLGDDFGQRPALVLAVVPGDRGVGGQVQHVRLVVALLEVDGQQVEDRRDQHDPVEVHAVTALEVGRQARGTDGPVGLAGEELGRHPSAVPRGPQPDDLTDRFEVAHEPAVFGGLFAVDGSGESCRHRIDEHEIGVHEERFGVVDEVVGRRDRRSGVARDDPSRAEEPEMEPDAR